jgi:hypothetical protein
VTPGTGADIDVREKHEFRAKVTIQAAQYSSQQGSGVSLFAARAGNPEDQSGPLAMVSISGSAGMVRAGSASGTYIWYPRLCR